MWQWTEHYTGTENILNEHAGPWKNVVRDAHTRMIEPIQAMHKMKKGKSPGPDGVPMQSCEGFSADDLMVFVLSNKALLCVNNTCTTLRVGGSGEAL